jgi:hypothetical protein
LQRQRHQEFIRFLNAIEAELPADKAVNVTIDNYLLIVINANPSSSSNRSPILFGAALTFWASRMRYLAGLIKVKCIFGRRS